MSSARDAATSPARSILDNDDDGIVVEGLSKAGC
jgi:hypothetical protein